MARSESAVQQTPAPPGTHLRPSERVMNYLLERHRHPDSRAGDRLPAIRTIASELGVSVPTVHSVVQKLRKQGKVSTQVGNGTFLVPPPKELRQMTIALGFRKPESSPMETWGYRIYGGMLSAAMNSAKPIAFLPLPQCESSNLKAVQQMLLSELAEVDGLVQFPYGARGEEVRQAFEAAGKPVVNLNPPWEFATSNFVSPDYYGASFQLGKAWKETGRRRVLLMLGWPAELSVSSRLRLAGLVNGLALDLDGGISCRVLSAVAPPAYIGDWQDGYGAMRRSLENGDWVPDAVYCHGDLLAVGAVKAAREAGLDVPRDVSVVAGSGIHLADPACPGLTATHQPLEEIGGELVKMLCQRITSRNHGMVCLPGQFFPTPFVGGATTRKEENAILQIGGESC